MKSLESVPMPTQSNEPQGLNRYLPDWLRRPLGHSFDSLCRLLGYDRLKWERMYFCLEEEYAKLKSEHQTLMDFIEPTSGVVRNSSLLDTSREGLYIPSVDDYWKTSRAYPVYRKKPFYNLLKSYGGMAIREYMDSYKPSRMLEFGHGVWSELDRCLFQPPTDGVEMWGVDDFAEYNYLTDRTWWEGAYGKYKAERPHVHFVQAYLGTPEATAAILPENYFELICSVSVLEELPIETSRKILEHCYHLLVPGGKLIFSWDIKLREWAEMSRTIKDLVRSCGFCCECQSLSLPEYPLRENQLQVILWYQQHQGEDRQYWGEYSTIVVQAHKAAV